MKTLGARIFNTKFENPTIIPMLIVQTLLTFVPHVFMLIQFFILQMMECGQCKCWVHAKCEGLSDEKYQVLSYLPESVEFICRLVIVLPLT
jgi:hypothetical protein